MHPFLHGILMGLTITISIGPGFMAIFQTSISWGVKAGFVLAVGILASDLFLLTVCYFGFSNLLNESNHLATGIIAGSILILMGGFSILRKPKVQMNELNKMPDQQPSLPVLLMKGFLLNIANPFVSIFWIGMIGYAASNYGMRSHGFYIFFTGLILTAFSSDLLKCYLSGFLKKILASHVIIVINKALGAVFILLGIFIIYKVMV